MKIILYSLTVVCIFALGACKTTQEVTPTSGTSAVKATANISVPAGFNWQNSRNVNFTVNVTDTRFAASIYLVSVYNGDPATGSSLLAKGSATNSIAFKSKIYLSNLIKQVYIVKTAPDKSTTTQIAQVGTADLTTSIGI
ncbi:hypothetical protein [Mucilaginibacter sp.]|uniref:hypothetical protein n=1 Tax=Mucilaginibacter sp. TaxID=1882438 RepID=UPI003D0AE4D5